MKINQLESLLKSADIRQEFNIVEDLKSLELSFGIIKTKDFRKKLKALIEKYENNELTGIREALIQKCLKGDVQAIRLYSEYFKPEVVNNTDDGLLEALTVASEEAFADEI